MAKIYTRTGDKGQTSLGDGSRTDKCAARVDLYGDVDELNSQLGYCVARLRTDAKSEDTVRQLIVLAAALESIQHQLFDLGSLLADPGRSADQARLSVRQQAFQTSGLEALIDELTGDLAPLRQFILPGGSEVGALIHIARTICRRAERKAVALGQDEPVPASAIGFLNRLSDLLFTVARSANRVLGEPDVPWRPDAGADTEQEDS